MTIDERLEKIMNKLCVKSSNVYIVRTLISSESLSTYGLIDDAKKKQVECGGDQVWCWHLHFGYNWVTNQGPVSFYGWMIEECLSHAERALYIKGN